MDTMDGWEVAGQVANLFSRFPVEKLVARRSSDKDLDKLEERLKEKGMLSPGARSHAAPLETVENHPGLTNTSETEKQHPSAGVLERPAKESESPTGTSQITAAGKTPEAIAQRGEPLTTEKTVRYQNREIGKQLLAMEFHYAQRMRIDGVPCDCGSTKHLLYLELLGQETIPMVKEPSVYEKIIAWVRENEPKSTDEAAKSGKYDNEYPALSGQARDFRKGLVGSLELGALIEPHRKISLEEAIKQAAETAAKA